MMLQSWTFLFGFLPTTVLIYTTLIKFFYHHGLAVALLLVASLSFATLPGAENALLILSSTLFNYLVARWIWTRPAV